MFKVLPGPLRRLWSNMVNIGVHSDLTLLQRQKVKMLNTMILVLLPIILYFCFQNTIYQDYTGLMINITSIFLIGLTLIFQHQYKHFWAKFYIGLLSMFIIGALAILYGKGLGGEFFFVNIAVFILFFFDTSLQKAIMFVFLLLTYISTQLGQYHIKPPLEDELYGSTYHIIFFFNIYCLLFMNQIFISSMLKYQDRANKFLKRLTKKNKKLQEQQELLEESQSSSCQE